ncbi:acyl carrier protein [Ramlibacter sp.]|uniref:acyl carrier protein n=1 Tax=Ramlibacter sp. TaxID=1917967 RepID=UPI0017B96C26|nr:acyl carrier protein [Ramlibacter sp.]MBA2675268.1 acyl carrier protein [Ramlibacter sp.]
MAEPHDVAQVVQRICIDTLGYADFGEDEDFFSRGASSLTIVDMQLKIEEALGCKAATSELMLHPSMAGWSRIYRAVAEELSAG